jgi:tRNA(Ile)-lysidine synthetase-like protein
MEQTLLAYCRRQGLFRLGDRVIVACSGGADSMALLCFLLRCKAELGITVMAAHVDHGIRGEAAHADARFVAEFCRTHHVPFFLYDAAASGVQIPPNPSENWARSLRYTWFDALAAQQHACIATAHTLSDQAETVLFRMARGTGLHGMAGIPARARAAEAALRGKPFNETVIRDAMAALAEDFSPLSDMRASAHYRLTVARNLLLRFYLRETGALAQEAAEDAAPENDTEE